MTTSYVGKIENGAKFNGKWFQRSVMEGWITYDVTTYSDNSQMIHITGLKVTYSGWVEDQSVRPIYCTACCGNWSLNWGNDFGGNAMKSWNFQTSIPLGNNTYTKNVDKTIYLDPGQSSSVQVFKLVGAGECGTATRSCTFNNTNTRPTPRPPTLNPSCYANTANGNTIVFNGGGSWGYCNTGYNSSSYAVYDNEDMTTPIKSGSGYSATVSGLSPNTRYWASFSKSNGCYSRSATCTAVTVTPNSLSDAKATSFDKGSVRLSVTNGGGEYDPNTTIWIKKCVGGSWRQIATSTTKSVEEISFDGLDPETCYQLQARTTTPAGTYTGNTVQFTTPKKDICIVEISTIDVTMNEKNYNVCANICYDWESTKVPATLRLYYRVKDGYDDRWYYVDLDDATELTGSACAEICDLYPNQTIYETYIHSDTGEAQYDSQMREFVTPVIPEPDIHNCENFDYLAALLCQAVVALYNGQKEIYANDCSKEACDPYSQNPTLLTLWSRALRLFHAMYCLLCDMGGARFTASKPGQYLVGEAGWQDIITEIKEGDPEGWKIATSDAVKRYLMAKLHQVWHYHEAVDVLVYELADLDKFPDATSAIIASENKIYRKVDGIWTVSTAEGDQVDDMGVWHINMESSTQVGYVQAGSAWYYWQGNWQPMDADVIAFAKIIDAMWEKKDQASVNETGKDRLHVITCDREDFDCSALPAGERWVSMITEPMEIAPPDYHLLTFETGENATIVQNQEVMDGALPQKPTDPEKTCMDFVTWNDKETGTEFDWSMPVTKDYELVAVWSPHPVTITFDIGDQATGDIPEPIHGFCGDAIGTLVTTGFTRPGGTFDHWAIDGVPIDSTYILERNSVAVAVWTMEEETVTFVLGNGEADIVKTTEYGNTVTAPANPTRTDYIFTGWFTDSGFTTAWDSSAEITSNLTVYAGWIPAAYTVTFNSNGGSPVAPQTVAYQANATRPADPTRDGYIIKEWQLNGVAYNFDVPVTEDITLDAVWDKVWTVTFDVDGGTPEVVAQVVKEGELANVPQSPTKEGCTFGGWYDASGEEPECPTQSSIQLVSKVYISAYGCSPMVEAGEMSYETNENPPYQLIIPKSELVVDAGGLDYSELFFVADNLSMDTGLSIGDTGDNLMVNGQVQQSATTTFTVYKDSATGEVLGTIPLEVTYC